MEFLVRPNTLPLLLALFSDVKTGYGERHLAKTGALRESTPMGPRALKLAKGYFLLGSGEKLHNLYVFSLQNFSYI